MYLYVSRCVDSCSKWSNDGPPIPIPFFDCAEVKDGKHSATPCVPNYAYVCKAPSGTLNSALESESEYSSYRTRVPMLLLLHMLLQTSCPRATRSAAASGTPGPALSAIASTTQATTSASGNPQSVWLSILVHFVRMEAGIRVLFKIRVQRRSDVCADQRASLPVIRNAGQQTWIDYRLSGKRYWLALLPDPEVRPLLLPTCSRRNHSASPTASVATQDSPNSTSRRWKWPNGEPLAYAPWHLSSGTGEPDNDYQKYARAFTRSAGLALPAKVPFVHVRPQLPLTQERYRYRTSLLY